MKIEMAGEMKTVKADRLSEIRKLFQRNVVPTYARFDLALDHGEGSYVFDVAGKRYLDLGGGIAVCALGHANPEITDALLEQSRKLLHVSNLYFTKPQAQLAEALVRLIGSGRPGTKTSSTRFASATTATRGKSNLCIAASAADSCPLPPSMTTRFGSAANDSS